MERTQRLWRAKKEDKVDMVVLWSKGDAASAADTPWGGAGGSLKWSKNGVEKRVRKRWQLGSLGDPKWDPKSVDL